MATIRPGTKTALLVVDAQAGVVAGAWERDRVVGNIAQVVDRARAQGAPVVWVQHQDDELVSGSDAWQWAQELEPSEGEPTVAKSFNSAFERTNLEPLLAELGVNHLVLAGAATNWCIRATAYAALDRGYDLTLVKDAHTTEDIEFADGRRVEAKDIIADLNVAMNWLDYPERRNAALAASEVSFEPGEGEVRGDEGAVS